MEYSIRTFSKDGIGHFCTLFKAVYGKTIARAYVEKKFDTAYLIPGYFGHFAFDGDNPVAFYGVVPTPMNYGSKTEIAAQSVDTMTHPKHRGKGLFPQLAQLTYKKMAEAGISFVWGFPNQNSEPVFLEKLGWHYNDRMTGYLFQTGASPLLGKMFERRLKTELLRHTTNWPTLAEAPFVSVFRNDAYYKYKSFSDNFWIALNGCYFWIKIKNGILVGDFHANTKDIFENGLASLIAIAKKQHAATIVFQMSPGTQKNNWLGTLPAKRFDSWIAGYKNFHSTLPLDKLKFTLADADIF
jgi:hypothetical protein